MLAAARGCKEFFPKPAHQTSHHRGDQKCGDRQLPVDIDHVANYHNKLQDTGDKLVKHPVNHLSHPIHILREPIGQVAGAGTLEVAQVEGLEVRIHTIPQIECHR